MTDSPKIQSRIRGILEGLPEGPGVYKFISQKGKILYIGKAKSLLKRVRSYFPAKSSHSFRIQTLVAKTVDIAFTVTNSESEALLLENNLIKQHLPRYNINLKDGKSYPFVCIKNERFPRVFPTRNKIRDGSAYFGPYASVKTLNAILELIRQNYQVRTCNLNLSADNIAAMKFRICLEYQIGNCLGPCEGLQSEEEYSQSIDAIRKILRGNYAPILEQLQKEMDQASAEYRFEEAEKMRQKLEKIRQHRRNFIFADNIQRLEVLTIAAAREIACVTHFKVDNGTIVETHSFESRLSNGGVKEEVLSAALSELAATDENFAPLILMNVDLPAEEIPEGIQVIVPKSGEKWRLVELGLKNCNVLLEEKIFRKDSGKKIPNREGMQQLMDRLHLNHLPVHIECFDNSNLQGSHPVASLVVFKNGKPSKKDYRHFHIKTVEGPDDFASMEEIVFRRYRRMQDESLALPNVVMVDGGKGQLSSAAKSLEKLGLMRQVCLISIAKKLEEIYVPGDPVPLHIDKRSPALKMIQEIRNEAHRFAITFHRNLRSKDLKQTDLLKVPGIGEATARTLLKEFRSLKKIKLAPVGDLQKAIGRKKAEALIAAIKEGKI